MPNTDENNPLDIDSSVYYDHHYYENDCGGYAEFKESPYEKIPARMQMALLAAGIKPGGIVIDLACGRGEIVYHAVKAGARAWGIDYAIAALNIASSTLNKHLEDRSGTGYGLSRASALQVPLGDSCADVVFMLDIVEHLHSDELDLALSEVYRILKPQGRLIIHTSPNLWYYQHGYPSYRFFMRLRKKNLPENPRDRWKYGFVHVNEQSPRSLRQVLSKTGFKAKVWQANTQSFDQEANPTIRWIMKLLATTFPLKYIFGNDIFAIASKG